MMTDKIKDKKFPTDPHRPILGNPGDYNNPNTMTIRIAEARQKSRKMHLGLNRSRTKIEDLECPNCGAKDWNVMSKSDHDGFLVCKKCKKMVSEVVLRGVE